MFFSKRQKGQGLVEFALILPVLLMVVLGLIETALLFQAYLAIQHGAREAARFAVSMQPPQGMMFVDDPQDVCGDDNPAGLCPCDESTPDNILEETCDPDEDVTEWQNRRVRMIKKRALESSYGVRIRDDKLLVDLNQQDYFDTENHPELSGDYLGVPKFFGVRVFGYTKNELGQLVQQEDHPSLGGLYVAVIVYHRAEVIDPLFQAIVDSVLLEGRAEMINEGLQIAGPPPSLDVPEVLDPEGPPPLPPNDPPDTPVNESPDDPEGLNPEETSNPQFRWSPYNDNDGDPQRYFQVQLRTSGGDYGSAGRGDSGPVEVDSPPVDSWTPSDWDLLDGEYCWHVRVRDDRGAWSDYSDETCFFVDVGMSNPPDTPINVSPGDSSDSCVTIRTAHPQFQWSDYVDLDGDPQSHLQIQLRASGVGYGSGSRDTGQVASSVSIYTPPWYLDDGQYYWRVRVRDNRGLWSDYSSETCFIVEAEPYLAVIGDHEEGEPFVLGEDVMIVIGKHAVTTDYELWWVDPDDVGHSFASVTSDDEGFASQLWSLIDPPDPPDWLELIPNGVGGQVYTCTVQSRVPTSGDVVAYQDISVQVPEDLPDLAVTGITLPDSPLANVPMTITVDIANLTYSTIEDFFDVNVYVDPVRSPTLGRPGDSLQWVDGIGPMETRTMTFVITLIGLGDHEVWAYVDATNTVDNERDEDNNRYGPVSTFAGCEE
jgi:hypothetical protein